MSLRIDTSEWISGALVIGDVGAGVLAEDIPSTGDDGPPYAYNDLTFPADNGKEICGRITTWPAAGTLYAYEDTSFTFIGAPDGTYTFQYQLYADYVAIGSPATVTLTVGGSGVSVSAAWTEEDDVTAIAAQSDAAGQPMIGGGGAGPSRRKLEDFLKSLEPKKRKKPRKKQRKPAAVVELAPFDPQELAFVEEPSAPPTDIELLLAQSMPVQVPQLYSAPAAIDQMLMQHRMRQQQQAQAEEDRIIELLLLM